MRILNKYLIKPAKRFNISPVDSGGALRILIYAVWSINVLAFLGYDFSFYSDNFDTGSSNHAIYCTVLKKVKNIDLHLENFKLVSTNHFIVIQPVNSELHSSEFEIFPSERGPPEYLS